MGTEDLVAARELLPGNPINLKSLDFNLIKEVLPELRERGGHLIEELEKLNEPGWNDLLIPLQKFLEEVEALLRLVGHFAALADTPETRILNEQVLVESLSFLTDLYQNQKIYRQIQRLKENSFNSGLNSVQVKVLVDLERDFYLYGADLDCSGREEVKKIFIQLSKLGVEFANNVIDGANASSVRVDSQEQLVGIPSDIVNLAKEKAIEEEFEGWIFELSGSSFLKIMRYADDDQFRFDYYRRYCTQASCLSTEERAKQNEPIINKILQLRQNLAEKIGDSSYSEYSMHGKMAESSERVNSFLNQFGSRLKELAQPDFERLSRFVKEEFGLENINPWQIQYYSEKLRQKEIGFDEEELRPYFKSEELLERVLKLFQENLNLEFKKDSVIGVWDEKVLTYQVFQEKRLKGYLYLDLYSRSNKRSGAWMEDLRPGRFSFSDGKSYLFPVAVVAFNFTPPDKEGLSLLTHSDLETIFHELGHAFHHLLSRVQEAAVAGTRGVPWDAIEIASQYIEKLAWEPNVLESLGLHYQTGEPIPADLIEKVIKNHNFQRAMTLTRQVSLACFDQRIHAYQDPKLERNILRILRHTRDEFSVPNIYSVFDRMPMSFHHLFSGEEYAACYYSYLWSEIIANFLAEHSCIEYGSLRESLSPFSIGLLGVGGSASYQEIISQYIGKDFSFEEAKDIFLSKISLSSNPSVSQESKDSDE